MVVCGPPWTVRDDYDDDEWNEERKKWKTSMRRGKDRARHPPPHRAQPTTCRVHPTSKNQILLLPDVIIAVSHGTQWWWRWISRKLFVSIFVWILLSACKQGVRCVQYRYFSYAAIANSYLRVIIWIVMKDATVCISTRRTRR